LEKHLFQLLDLFYGLHRTDVVTACEYWTSFALAPTYRVSAEQNAGGEHVVLVVLLEVVADDERRRHVDETGAEAVHDAVGEEEPLGRLYERRPDAADRQHAGAEQTADAEAAMTEHADESDRQRGARQRDTERQRPDPVCRQHQPARHRALLLSDAWPAALTRRIDRTAAQIL